MANKGFILPCRNDLPHGLVQFTDVQPNTSQANPGIQGPGQTAYIDHGHYAGTTWVPPFTAPLPVVAGGGTLTGTTRGLAVYILDHIPATDPAGADNALTAIQARSIAARLVLRVVSGQTLTLANLITTINSVGAMVTGTAPAITQAILDGTVAAVTGKTGAMVLEEILRVLAGDIYEILNGGIIHNGAGLWSNAGAVIHPAQVAGANASAFLEAPNPTLATQTWPHSTDYVGRRALYLSGSLAASAGEGNLSIFKRTPASAVPFGYTAEILPNGVTLATYGVANGASGNVRGTAHSNNVPITLGAGTLANPSIITCASHPFITGDIIRLNGATNAAGAAHPNALNGTYTVTAINATTFSCGINAASAIAAGATATFETTLLTNHVDIPATGQFRGIMVYDSLGNIL